MKNMALYPPPSIEFSTLSFFGKPLLWLRKTVTSQFRCSDCCTCLCWCTSSETAPALKHQRSNRFSESGWITKALEKTMPTQSTAGSSRSFTRCPSLFSSVCSSLVRMMYGFALPTDGKQVSITPNSHKSDFQHQPAALQPHQMAINASAYIRERRRRWVSL